MPDEMHLHLDLVSVCAAIVDGSRTVEAATLCATAGLEVHSIQRFAVTKRSSGRQSHKDDNFTPANQA